VIPSFRICCLALLRVFAIGALGAIVGLIFGHAVEGSLIALAGVLGWQLFQLERLNFWLRHRRLYDPPDPGGRWGDVVTLVTRLHRRKRFHKERVLQVLREVRRSTAALPDGVVLLNDVNEILWFNRTASKVIGLKREDLGLRIGNLLRQPGFVNYLAAESFATPVVVNGGAASDTYLSLQVVRYGDGQRLLLARDVTRQTRLEATRKDFVANASHELRSPLTVISGYLETIDQDSDLHPTLRGPVEEMRRQAQRMTNIIQDLLELSRIEAIPEEVSGSRVDVAALLSTLRKDVLARPQHPREVRVELDSPAALLGDERDVHSAFANLVDNAAKYTPPDGSLAMRWWVDEEGAHFSVADTGIGIAPEHLPRLTERFYRVDPGRSRATGGSGLGLAIVKHVLERHGAELAVESVPGRGSTFTCHFPARRVLAPRELERTEPTPSALRV
jgi:two-component system phosphate regulon sensor histidine kinase PhoR